ncbi:C-type lectin domain family 2 member D isoform X2 [Anolis carolinensis]|uniref:C-type lectin domain family 2 member D isoform X2 n=1 Tax=Anolis carolinensis TaxID=28377 RepID=UPI002F2B7806
MTEEIREREGRNSGSEWLNPESDDTTHPQVAGAREVTNAVRKQQPCPVCPPPVDAACPDGWVGYQGKCYYRSDSEKNWSSSANHCSTFGAFLAVFETQQVLAFLVNFTRPLHYWIGLSKTGDTWRWPNGSEFKKQSLVRGDGECAYINDIGLSSTRCTANNLFLCSQDDACIRKKKHSTT